MEKTARAALAKECNLPAGTLARWAARFVGTTANAEQLARATQYELQECPQCQVLVGLSLQAKCLHAPRGSDAVGQPLPAGAEKQFELMEDAEAGPNDEGFRASLGQLFREDGWDVHYETGNLWRPSRSSSGRGVPIGRNQTGGGALEERQPGGAMAAEKEWDRGAAELSAL